MRSFSPTRLAIATAVALAAATLPARAAVTDSWLVIDADSDGDCRLEILGDGKFMLIRASGLGPREQGRFQVSNETMVPIDWSIITDTKGVFVRAYMPYLWWPQAGGEVRDYQNSGLVSVNISTRSCNLTASAPWQNRIRVIP
jgi:hypothetical protein